MPDLLDRFIQACQAANPAAAAAGFPPFTTPYRQETALNSGPYLYDLAGFDAAFGTSDRRRRILADCRASLDRLRGGGLIWHLALIGGSFVRGGEQPSDLDALLVYSIVPGGGADGDAGLAACLDAARTPLVDFKYCPADVHPVVLVKRVMFFASLFGYDRESGQQRHGTVMLIPDRAADD